MKNIFWTILAVALSACSEPYRGFVLDGKIQGADNELFICIIRIVWEFGAKILWR